MVAAQISIINLNEKTFETYLDMLRRCGISLLLISTCEFFFDGDERRERLEDLRKAIEFFEDKGLETVVWTNSLGYGIERDGKFHKMFPDKTGLTNFSGRTDTSVCSLDERFSDYICDNVRDFIKAGATTILWDDDLVQSVRPGFLCSCEKHLKMMSEETGRAWTREQVRDLFTGEPSENRSRYLDIMGKSMDAFCRKVRAAADEINPEVNMGLCASFTHYDIEGIELEKTLKILAADGKQPLFRFSGAPYWACFAQRYPGQNLAGVLEFVKMQHGWYSGKGLRLLDENDCYPRDTRIVPSSYVELYDKVMLAFPDVIRHKYILCFGPENGCRKYMETHIMNMDDDAKISGIVSGFEPDGLRIYQHEHMLRDAVLTDEYAGDGKIMGLFSQPYAGIFAALNSVPTKYSGTDSGIVFGENAKYLTDEELRSGLIMDMKAAMILEARGIDTGFESCEPADNPSVEKFGGRTEKFSEKDGHFYCCRLRKGCTVVSTFEYGETEIPACWLYENSLGMKFAVYAWNADDMTYGYNGETVGAMYSVGRQKQLEEIYGYVSGRKMTANIQGADNVYLQVLADKEKTAKALVICNISPDVVINPVIELDGEYEIAEQLRDGEWSAGGGKLKGGKLLPYSYSAIRLKRNSLED